jgi:hypothetical protein
LPTRVFPFLYRWERDLLETDGFDDSALDIVNYAEDIISKSCPNKDIFSYDGNVIFDILLEAAQQRISQLRWIATRGNGVLSSKSINQGQEN